MAEDVRRLWLIYPNDILQEPIIYRLGHEFDIVTNVRQATVQDGLGLITLELRAEPDEIDRGIEWLEGLGIKVQPVEINTIES